MRYHYSVVRFVPYPVRGEFINVAVIAGSDESGEWGVRRVENPLHALRLGGDRDRLSAVWRYLDSVEGRITSASEAAAQASGAAGMSIAWLEEEYAYHRNLVQLTSPVPVAAKTVQEALNGMFDLFVVDPEKAARHTRKAAINALRGAFLGTDLPSSYLHERVTAAVGPQQIPIDFAVANGHLVQLAHAWSFGGRRPQTTVQQVKAWSWTVRDLRVLRRDGTNSRWQARLSSRP
jgi:hypothetical protein